MESGGSSLQSAETQGQLVAAKRSKQGRSRSDESFQEERKEPLGNESLQTISKRVCERWLLIEQRKYFVFFCPIGEQ